MTDFKLNNVENIDRLSVLNDNFDKIENELNENTLKRDGTRDLKGSLNANGNRIFNLPNPVDNKDVATVEYVLQTATGVDIISGVASVNGRTGAVGLAKEDVQLDEVDNTSDLGKPVSTAQQSALDDKINVGEAVESVNGRAGDVQLTRADVNLSNVNNTTDMNKPVSTAQQAAIDAAQAHVFFEGWEYIPHKDYDGTTATEQDVGTADVQVEIDGTGTTPNFAIDTYLPKNASHPLWDTTNNILTPLVEGDCYVIRFGCTVDTNASNASVLTFKIDIGDTSPIIVFQASQDINKNSVFNINFTTNLFVLDTFIVNGAKLLLSANEEGVKLREPEVFIQRTFSPVL